MKHQKRHQAVWSFLRFILGPWLRHKFNYSHELCSYDGPCLMLANHDTDWDPLLVSLAFPKQMYFVASEHIFRWGLITKLLKFFFDPIARLKGTTAGDTALTMLRRLKKGASVAMFANGNRSFNGRSEDILPSTGKLARACGAALITYRIEGGYFSSPRWCGSGLRRGRMTGKIMHIYTPEMLKSMSVDEINAAIDSDLYMDAYKVQREEMHRFRGKRLAENLETVLCVCPKCGEIGTMRSSGSSFSCSCGYNVTYNECGFFEGEDVVYDNVSDWDDFQNTRLCEIADKAGDEPILLDEGFSISLISSLHKSIPRGRGSLCLYSGRLECCGMVFPLSELRGFALHGASVINLSHGDKSYEIIPDKPCCTRKYMTLIRHLSKKTAAV